MDYLENEECAIFQAVIPHLGFGDDSATDRPLKILGLKLAELLFGLEGA